MLEPRMLALLALALQAAPPAADAPRGLAVIAPAAWRAELAEHAAARARELPCELVALEDVLAAESGADAPERLKRWLWRAWRERALGYALLVGDADTLPVRFMVLDRVTEPAFHRAFYPSDHYYADLAEPDGAFDDWNGAREGVSARYFGEVRGEHVKDGPIDHDGVSYVPEIAVGRWPVSSIDELRAVVAKTLAWRGPGARPRVLAVHADGWVDARPSVGALCDALAGAGFEVARQLYGEPGLPSPASVLAALVSGRELALHVGHGTNESWHDCLGPAERDALGTAPPAVYFSVGCSTAHFCVEPPYQPYLDADGVLHRGTNDGEVFSAPPPPPAPLQPGPLDESGLGERLLLQPTGGAVAYIGCDTGAQPCALTLLEGFTAALAHDRAQRVGDAWRAALAHYHQAERLAELVPTDSWYPPSVFFQGMKFVLLGDPTLPLAPAAPALANGQER
jgi:hypothetical protein